jgi:hypothetical protein
MSLVTSDAEAPALALTETLSNCPGLVEQGLGGLDVEDRQRPAAEVVGRAERPDALDRVGLRGPVARDLDRVADREVVLARRAGVEDDLLGAVRPAALLERKRRELPAVVSDADPHRLALAADHLAVLVEQRRGVGVLLQVDRPRRNGVCSTSRVRNCAPAVALNRARR